MKISENVWIIIVREKYESGFFCDCRLIFEDKLKTFLYENWTETFCDIFAKKTLKLIFLYLDFYSHFSYSLQLKLILLVFTLLVKGSDNLISCFNFYVLNYELFHLLLIHYFKWSEPSKFPMAKLTSDIKYLTSQITNLITFFPHDWHKGVIAIAFFF